MKSNSEPDSELESPYKYIPLGMSFDDYHQNRATKAKKIVGILQSKLGDLSELSLLDIGCHDGGLTCHFADFFKTVVGIDNDAVSVGIASETFKAENLTFMATNGSVLPFERGAFNVIITNHVFNYVDDKQFFVDEIARTLRPEGLCYLSTTNGLYTDLIVKLPAFLKNPVTSLLLSSSENFGSPVRYDQYYSCFKKVTATDMTYDIIKHPKEYAADIVGVNKVMLNFLSKMPEFFLRKLSKLSPTFIFLLSK